MEKFALAKVEICRKWHGLTVLEYKLKEKVECFPLVLPSKRHVVVLQNTAKKYIKARATSETQLSHLVCKIYAANPGIKLSGLEMKRKP